MSREPDISIVVPIYNVDEYLAECLDSITRNVEQAARAGYTAEVLLVDDGSTDASGHIARSYESAHDFAFYHRQENGGLSAARNEGAARAHGRYLQFVDADDVVLDNTFVKAIGAADASGCDMVVYNAVRYDGIKYFTSSLHFLAFKDLAERVTHITRNKYLVYDATAWNKLIRTSFYRAHSFTFPEGKFYEDTPVTLPMHYEARCVVVLMHTGYAWRVRSGATKSVTQRSDELRVFSDKLEMMGKTIAYADSRIAELELATLLRGRFLERDFRSHLDEMQYMKRADAETFFEAIRRFLQEYYVGFRKCLSAYSQQLMVDILNGDMEHAVKLNNYRMTAYNRARIVEQGFGMFWAAFSSAMLRDSFCDVTDELTHMPPSCFIDEAGATAEAVVIRGHVYRRRVNIAYPDGQSVRAFLQNDRTGKRVELSCSPWKCEAVTKAHGKIISYDDFCGYSYNYDGSGFEISIEFDALELDERMSGDNYIVLAYENRLETAERLLTGMSKATQKKLEGVSFARGDRSCRVWVDCRKAVVARIG